LRVTTVCEFPRSIWRPGRHQDSFTLIRAIKGRAFSESAHVPLGGQARLLTPDNRDDALLWAGEMLAPHIRAVFGSAPVGLVPIPGSRCTSSEHVLVSRGGRLARAVVTALGTPTCQVHPMLWWDRPRIPSHRGGARSPEDLAPRYRLAQPPDALLDTLPELVLIDDVLTRAGHFRSAVARLRAAGYRVADTAFAVGRTVWPNKDSESYRLPTEAAFSATTETFDDFAWP